MLARSFSIKSGAAFFLLVSFAFPQTHISPLVYQRVDADMQKGDFSQAETTLHAALKDHPRDPEALGLLGVVLDAEKKYEKAGIYYREALRLDPHSVSLWNNLGNHDLAIGNAADARRAYRHVIALDPHHTNANLQLAKTSVEAGRGSAALQYLAALPGQIEHQPAVEILRAKALHLTGRSGEADAMLEKLAIAGGGDPRVAFSVGMTEVEWKEYKAAEESLRRALSADPTNFDILYNLGLSALKAGDLKTARQMLDVAIAERPDDVDTLYNLAWLDTQSGQDDKAIVGLVRAHRLAPRRADILLLVAQVSENLGFYGDAAEAFANYLKLKPKDDLVRREYGFALAHTRKIEEAVAVLRAYVDGHPTDGRGLYELGVAESVNDTARSLSDLKRAVAVDPKFLAAKYALGDVLYRQGHFRQVVKMLTPLLEQDPNNYRALEALGEAELQLNDPGQAVKYLGRAAQFAPGSRKVLLQYGQALERDHQYQKALAVLQRFQQLPPPEPRPYSGLVDYLSTPQEHQQAEYLQHLRVKMELNPQDTALKILWAKAMLTKGNTREGLQTFDEILALHPSTALLTECGIALLAHAQYVEAEKFFSQAVLPHPSPPEDILDLSIAMFHTSGAEKALVELEQMPPSSRRGDYYLLRAQILDAMGRPQEAANDLTLGLRADPTRPDLYFQAALFLLKHNQPRELLALLRQAVVKFPDSRMLILTEAITYGLLRQFEKADQIMSQVEARWPAWDEAYLIHGITLVGNAKMKKAKPLLETAIALGNRDPFAYYNLALCDMEIFPVDVPAAAGAIQMALKLNPNDPYTQSLAGEIAFTQGDYPAALTHLNTAIRMWPDMIKAHETLSATYRAMGERQKASAQLEEIVRIKQRIRSADQAPPMDFKSFLFSVPGPAPAGPS